MLLYGFPLYWISAPRQSLQIYSSLNGTLQCQVYPGLVPNGTGGPATPPATMLPCMSLGFFGGGGGGGFLAIEAESSGDGDFCTAAGGALTCVAGNNCGCWNG